MEELSSVGITNAIGAIHCNIFLPGQALWCRQGTQLRIVIGLPLLVVHDIIASEKICFGHIQPVKSGPFRACHVLNRFSVFLLKEALKLLVLGPLVSGGLLSASSSQKNPHL
jgi:hypothetical protein